MDSFYALTISDNDYGGTEVIAFVCGPNNANFDQLYIDYEQKLRADFKTANKKWRRPSNFASRFVQWLTTIGFVEYKFTEVVLEE